MNALHVLSYFFDGTNIINKNKTIFNYDVPFVVCCCFSGCIGIFWLSIRIKVFSFSQ